MPAVSGKLDLFRQGLRPIARTTPQRPRAQRSPPPYKPGPSRDPRSSRSSRPPTSPKPADYQPLKRPATPVEWARHRERIKRLFPAGWNPPKKISREAMALMRQVHEQDPVSFSVPALADRFRISPEAVRRILRSRWAPTPEQEVQMRKREMEADERREREREVWERERKVREGQARLVMRRVGAAKMAHMMLGGGEEDAPAVMEEHEEQQPMTQGRRTTPAPVTTPTTTGRQRHRRITVLDRLRAARARALEAPAAHPPPRRAPSPSPVPEAEPPEPFDSIVSIGLDDSPAPTRDFLLRESAGQPTSFPTLGISARLPLPRSARTPSLRSRTHLRPPRASLPAPTPAPPSLAALSRPPPPPALPPPRAPPPSLQRPNTASMLTHLRSLDVAHARKRLEARIANVARVREKYGVDPEKAREAEEMLSRARMGRSRG